MKNKYSFVGAGLLVMGFILWLSVCSIPAAIPILLGKNISIYGNYAVLAVTELLLLAPLVVYMLVVKLPVRALMGNRTGVAQNVVALLLGVVLAPAVSGLTVAWSTLFTEVLHAKLPDMSMYEPRTLGALAAGAVAMGVTAGVAEEPIFRGVVLRSFGGHARQWASILLSGLVFSLIHMDLVGAPTRFVIGVALGMLAWQSGAVLPGIFAHAGYNSASLGISLISATTPLANWQGFRFLQGLPRWAGDILNWTILSLPFIALAWLAWLLFCRLTPATARWAEVPYARGPIKGYHWLPWVGAGLLTLGMVILTFAAMYLPQLSSLPGFGG